MGEQVDVTVPAYVCSYRKSLVHSSLALLTEICYITSFWNSFPMLYFTGMIWPSLDAPEYMKLDLSFGVYASALEKLTTVFQLA